MLKYAVGAFIVIVGGILWWARAQYVIGLNPVSLTIKKDTTGTYTVQLMYKPWFKRKFKPISARKLTSTAPPSIVAVNPAQTTTNSAGGRIATITVTAVASGTGQIIVNGTSRKGTHDTAKVSVTVP